MLWDIIMVFLAASGTVLLIWCLIGVLVHPVFDESMVTFLPISEDAGGVEQSVRAYAWLRSGGRSGGRLILVDCGLNQAGLERTEALCKQFDWLVFCKDLEAQQYIRQ